MVTLPGESVSYWMESAAPTSYPRLDGDVDADVAVIGGGMAGLCTAWEPARTGRSVQERRHTGRSSWTVTCH